MSAVTITGRVVEQPRLSTSGHAGRPDVRCSFTIAGLHSGSRVTLHATELAERIVATVVPGDVITATCWSEARGDSWRLFLESFSVHPEPVS
jgi:hypothetical protein